MVHVSRYVRGVAVAVAFLFVLSVAWVGRQLDMLTIASLHILRLIVACFISACWCQCVMYSKLRPKEVCGCRKNYLLYRSDRKQWGNVFRLCVDWPWVVSYQSDSYNPMGQVSSLSYQSVSYNRRCVLPFLSTMSARRWYKVRGSKFLSRLFLWIRFLQSRGTRGPHSEPWSTKTLECGCEPYPPFLQPFLWIVGMMPCARFMWHWLSYQPMCFLCFLVLSYKLMH